MNKIVQDEKTGPYEFDVICPKGHRSRLGSEIAAELLGADGDIYASTVAQLKNMECVKCEQSIAYYFDKETIDNIFESKWLNDAIHKEIKTK